MGDVLAYSGALRRLAVEVGKVASDLRLLSMGPRAGLAEIQLPPVQPGSSIMPGKVNPSMPEMVNQVCYQVIGLRRRHPRGGRRRPARAERDDAGDRLERAARVVDPARGDARARRRAASQGIRADEARCRELLDRSTAVATALSPYIGYAATADIAKTAVEDRTLDSRARARARAAARRAARRDPVAGSDDDAGRRRDGDKDGREDEPMTRRGRRRRAGACGARCRTRRSARSTRGCFHRQSSGMLEGPDRDAWQRPEQIMDALYIGEGSVVADLGAGGGWFTIRLARRVGPNGTRLRRRHPAADDQAIERRVRARRAAATSKTVLGTATDPKLPAARSTPSLIVDTYHEMEQPVTLLRNVATSLKPDGRIGIVEFTKDGGGPGPRDGRARRPRARDPRRRGRGPASSRKRENFLRYQYLLVVRPAAPK